MRKTAKPLKKQSATQAENGSFLHLKKVLHPHTWRLLKKIDQLAQQEVKNAQQEVAVLEKEISEALASIPKHLQSKFKLVANDEKLQQLRDIATYPNFVEQRRRSHILHILAPEYKLQMLGGKTLQEAHSQLLEFLDEGFGHDGKKEVPAWGQHVHDTLMKALKGSFSSGESGLLKIGQLDAFVRSVHAVKNLLDNAPKKLEDIQNAKPMECAPDLPFDKERDQLAKDCFETAQQQLHAAGKFLQIEDVDTLALCVSDACQHYRLGLALLDGRPSVIIDKANGMKYSCKEGLTSEVWAFVDGEELESNLYKQALKARRDKKALSRALVDNISSSSLPSRKM